MADTLPTMWPVPRSPCTMSTSPHSASPMHHMRYCHASECAADRAVTAPRLQTMPAVAARTDASSGPPEAARRASATSLLMRK